MGIMGPVIRTARTRALRKSQQRRQVVEVQPVIIAPEPELESVVRVVQAEKRVPLVVMDKSDMADTPEVTDEEST